MKVYDTIIEKGHNKKEIDKILGEICASAEDHSATFTALKRYLYVKSNIMESKKKQFLFHPKEKFSAVSFGKMKMHII
ncbi:MAG: hypothetical protein L6V78_03045 [Clostridium sp.]|nr:MAG: hypothetical protein L6V78_03045 [Clostridium sp.]